MSSPFSNPQFETPAFAAQRSSWMLYGAYGTTGRRVLDEALSRGHRPVLAGRNAEQLAALGRATGLTTLTISLEDRVALRAALRRVDLVLHAAGPYQSTGPLMRAACLEAGCSYLDISGEIADFASSLTADAEARKAGIGIIPGVGYGVVFAEAVASHVATRLPEATWLRLSLSTQSEGRSRAAGMAAAAAIADGGRDIFQGTLRHQAIAVAGWRAPGDGAPDGKFYSVPLAELVAVQRSTGIPNIMTGIPMPGIAAAGLRIAGPWLGRLLVRQARRSSSTAPSQRKVEGRPKRSRVWAEVGNDAGARASAVLETGEGYQSAAAAAVRALELQLVERRVGALTPVEAFGVDLALSVPTTTIRDLCKGVASIE